MPLRISDQREGDEGARELHVSPSRRYIAEVSGGHVVPTVDPHMLKMYCVV